MNNAKTFGRNFASAAAGLLAAQLLTLLVSIFLARRLDVTAYGIFVFGFAFPSWFLVIVSLGLDDVMATDVAADRSRASEYLTTIVLIRLLFSAIAMVGIWFGTHLVIQDPFSRMITILLGVSGLITANAGSFSAVFRAFERQEFGAAVTIVERLVTVGATLLILFLGGGLLQVSFAFLGGSLLMLAISSAIVRRRFTWFAGRIDPASIFRILKRTVPFALFNAVGTFTITIGLVLLSVLHGPDSAGFFNAAFTLLFALFSFLSVVSLTTLPMMARIDHESQKRLASVVHRVRKFGLIVGVPLAFGGWFYAEAIITTFYGDAFRGSVESFRVLVLSFAVETATIGSGPALAATGHMRTKLYISVVGMVATIALSFALVPSFGPLGAAYAFLASRVLTSILGMIAIQRLAAPFGVSGTMIKSSASGSLMLLVLSVVPGLSLWAGILVGGLVYFAALLGLRGLSSEDRTVVWDALRGALSR